MAPRKHKSLVWGSFSRGGNVCDTLSRGYFFTKGYFFHGRKHFYTLGCGRYVAAVDAARPKGPFIATQLNSTRRRVQLRRRSVYSDADATQLN